MPVSFQFHKGTIRTLFEHPYNLNKLRIFPDVCAIERVMPPGVAVIIGEPTLLDGSLVLLLLTVAQKSLPISCVDSYFFCHNSIILVTSGKDTKSL